MSEEKRAEEMTKASEVVFSKVYVPAFIKAAAEAGLPINSEEDLASALKIAALVRIHEQAAVTKKSASASTLMSKVASQLEAITFEQRPAAPAAVVDADVRQALATLKQ